MSDMEVVAVDAFNLEKIPESAKNQGENDSSLITAIVMSDLVQLTRTEADQ